MACACGNVLMGSYSNQEAVMVPWTGRLAGIDRCVLDEVLGLWKLGIRTIESCCGHRVTSGYIAVTDQSIRAMVALGYQPDPTAPGRPEIFAPLWRIPLLIPTCIGARNAQKPLTTA